MRLLKSNQSKNRQSDTAQAKLIRLSLFFRCYMQTIQNKIHQAIPSTRIFVLIALQKSFIATILIKRTFLKQRIHKLSYNFHNNVNEMDFFCHEIGVSGISAVNWNHPFS